MDLSEYQRCSLIRDLSVLVTEAWHGRYDVVFDGGTLEHVFNFPNAIAKAIQLLGLGGALRDLNDLE